jgi:peptidoglycan/LPS O-acetylase OafA/YrhL
MYSYSIYLLHFFFVDNIARFIKSNITNTENIYVVLLLSVPSFLLMVPISYISYILIESPFLKIKKKYIL